MVANPRQIEILPETDALIRARIDSGEFASADEVVAEALRRMEAADRRALLGKWLAEGLTDEETERLGTECITRAQAHVRGLLEEGIRSGEEEGWIDGEEAMRELRARLADRQKRAG